MDPKPTKAEFTLDDFYYELPEELIAQQPCAVRHASRLLHIDRQLQAIEDLQFVDLSNQLQAGDLLVINDTKVIAARLGAKRQTGAQIDLLLLRPEATRPGVWLAMATNLRKLKEGEKLLLDDGESALLVDSIVEGPDGHKRLLVDFGGTANVYATLSRQGRAPLPPYIRRPSGSDDEKRDGDLQRYQTVFARAPGAVAAPTAGLHFSEEIFEKLQSAGVKICRLTLHVGPGTFKPITASLEEHSIESERFSISREAADEINGALDQKRRVIAVGTTSCRALETAGASGRVLPADDAETSLYIMPGFKFKIISGLITNFHLSRSSLLVLVAAFAGYDLTMRAYRHAVEQRYRFYSYGDAMLIT